MGQDVTVMAIGGGGFTHQADPGLETFLCDRLPERPKIGYIGAANNDDPLRIDLFHKRFTSFGAQTTHLECTAQSVMASRWLRTLDAIYVGGGNTSRLLQYWRQTGFDREVIAAARDGIVVSGVSAGASCWFEMALWDGNGTRFQPIRGLGLVEGSFCPHFSNDPGRAEAFRDYCMAGLLPAGHVADDGAALWIAGERQTVVARHGAHVRRIWRGQSGLHDLILP